MLTRVNTHFFTGRYHQHQGVVVHERSQIVVKSVIEFLSPFQKTLKIIQAENG
ncbi:MAG TPA: hypothetical protein V6D30_18210 [Leptolyngbyaceae cyanobacterium]